MTELLEQRSVSEGAWDGSTSRFNDEQWKHACAACEGVSDSPKTDCYLPHHEPSGSVNRAGVHNAAARFNQTERANKDKAKSHLAAHYRNDLKEDVPSVLGGEAKSAEKPCDDCDDRALGLIHPRASRAELRGTRETRLAARSEFEVREVPDGTGGVNLRFTGYAAVTSTPYEMEDFMGPWTESIEPGAFGRVISERHDVSFLLNHEGMTLARTKSDTLQLSEDSRGLHVEASLDPSNPTVQAMRSAVERKDLDEMSFAFRVNRQEWNDDYTRRWIRDVNMNQGDVSLVNYAANGATAGLVAMRRRQPDKVTQRAAFLAFKELREGKALSASTMDVLDQVLKGIASIDEITDDLQPMLAELMNVPDPDADGTDNDTAAKPIADDIPDDEALSKVSLWKQKVALLNVS